MCCIYGLLNLTKSYSSIGFTQTCSIFVKTHSVELTVFNLGRTYPSYYNADFWEEPLSHSTEQILGENWKQINPMVLQAKKKRSMSGLMSQRYQHYQFFLDKRLIFFAFLTCGVFELQVYPQSTKFRFPRESAMLGVYDKSVWAWEKKLMWIFHFKRLMCIRCWQRFNNLLILWRMRPMKRER